MRWVFIRPRSCSPYYDPELQEPLGIEYLAASRRSRGDPVLLLDCALDSVSEKRLARRAASFKPDAIGLSITTAQELDSLALFYAECMNLTMVPRPKWLAGGNFVSTEPWNARRLLPQEFHLVRFEGEHALSALADQWTSVDVPPAPDLLPQGCVMEGQPAADLDALPFPERPYADVILRQQWAFNLQGSRGCCGQCRFCASPGMRVAGSPRWRGRSPAHIVSEIQLLYDRFGARCFNFVDEDFLGPNHLARRRTHDFFEELQKRRLRAAVSIQVRPASMNRDIIEKLARAGVVYVFIGIESDSPDDFKRWNRPWTPEMWTLVDRLRQCDVEVNAGVMLFHPHATLAGIRRFAATLHRHHLLEYRSAINRLDAMPGSEFHTAAVAAREIPCDGLGPQPLPFAHPEVVAFREDLIRALAPLGPPSMHALCALPPVVSRRYLDNHVRSEYPGLKQILNRLDEATARTVFALLDAYENATESRETIHALRECNLESALEGIRDLVALGLAPSYDELREAIRIDAGV